MTGTDGRGGRPRASLAAPRAVPGIRQHILGRLRTATLAVGLAGVGMPGLAAAGSPFVGGVALAGVALAGAPAESKAQETRAFPVRSGSGWLGVNVRIVSSTDRPEGTITLSDVLPGSPAAEAGLQAGDRVLRLNGAPVSADRFRSVTSRLEAGDPIALVVLRDDQEIEVPVVAGQRPAPAQIVAVRLQEELDSVRSRFVRILESPEPPRPGAPGTPGVPGARLAHFTAPMIRVEQVGADSIATHIVIQTGGTGAPEVTGVFLEGPDGIEKGRLIQLTGSVTTEPRVAPAPPVEGERRAAELEAMARADARAEAWVPLRREAMESAERERAREQAERREASWPTRSIEEVRPLSPYVAGLTRVAGAELRGLNPGLGRYFGVGAGLLVTEVAEGTPAAEAGLRGGDVIVASGGYEVTTLDQLRERLSARGGRVLDVVRAGERISLKLR